MPQRFKRAVVVLHIAYPARRDCRFASPSEGTPDSGSCRVARRRSAVPARRDRRLGVGPGYAARDPGAPGLALVLYSRRDGEVMLVRRTDDGWTRQLVLCDSSIVPIQNLACDHASNCYFAYVNRADRGLWLARGSGDSWTIERVWQYPADSDLASPSTDYGLVTRIGRTGEPVLLVARRSDQNGWLRVYRLAARR